MALKTFVKVGNVNNLSDARYCAGMEVDLLGFNFDKNSDMDPDKFDEITTWISGVEFVAEFEDADDWHIREILEECDFDYVQITDPKLVYFLSDEIPVILKCSTDYLRDLPDKLPAKILLIEKQNDDTLTPDEIEWINKASRLYTVLLGTGITPDNVEQVLGTVNIKGIAMKGSNEIRPGYKDYDELADILELLETED